MRIELDDLRFSPTAWLFEGGRAGAGVSVFVARTPPGRFVELHTHPYAEPSCCWWAGGAGRRGAPTFLGEEPA